MPGGLKERTMGSEKWGSKNGKSQLWPFAEEVRVTEVNYSRLCMKL